MRTSIPDCLEIPKTLRVQHVSEDDLLLMVTRSMHRMLEKMVCKGGSWRSSKCEEGCKVGFNEANILGTL
uniref:Uncharacterized protein n=1 Tax=Vitis vinifera TaxID=29760 RepID=F6HJM7_VITVI